MKRLIEKHLQSNNKGSGKITLPYQTIRFPDNSTGYVKINQDGTPTEDSFDSSTGKIRVYGSDKFTEPSQWVTLDRGNSAVGIQRTPDNSDLLGRRIDEDVDRYVDQTVGSSDNFTPWGLIGLGINYGLGKTMSFLPESAQETLAYGRYLSPSYWISRASGETDNQIMNGQSSIFGTGTGTILDFFSAPTITKYGTRAITRGVPYLAGRYGGNAAIGQAGRGYTFSRMLDNAVKDVYGGNPSWLQGLMSNFRNHEIEGDATSGRLYSTAVPLHSIIQRVLDRAGGRDSSVRLKVSLEEFAEALPRFDYRRASIPEQAKYFLEDPDAVTTHPFTVRRISGDPELQAYTERLGSGEESMPIYTYPNGRLTPLIESAVGENVPLGIMLTARESGITTPHMVTLTGMRPILVDGAGKFELSGLSDFVTRNGYNFSTNSRMNATEYSWLGDARENIARLSASGFGKGRLNEYYLRLHKIIDDLNRAYGVKNYAYPKTVNTDVLPKYRDSETPVNFSLLTHLLKKPNGRPVEWNPIDRAIYDEAMDLLSQFWGENLNGGGVRETLIPKNIQLHVTSSTPIDYRLLREHPYNIGLERGNLPKTYRVFDTEKRDYVNRPLTTMDALEEWAKSRGIVNFRVGIANDPLPSTSYGNERGTFQFTKKYGGKIR